MSEGSSIVLEVISHLTTAIPVTVRLLCMHLSAEKKKKKRNAVNLLSISATQGLPPPHPPK